MTRSTTMCTGNRREPTEGLLPFRSGWGGRRKGASSVYIRDPDGNLLEFMIYS